MADRFLSGRLPAEPELADLLHVSRTTLRTALQRLEQAGLLSRAPARGTLVRPGTQRDTLALQRLVGFRELLEENGHSVRTEVEWKKQTAPDPRSQDALQLTGDEPMLRSSKTFFADERPAIFIWDELPLAVLEQSVAAQMGGRRRPDIPDSIFEFSHTWPGRQIHHSVVGIEPAVARGGEPANLRLPSGYPYIVLSEVHHAQDGTPVAYSHVQIDDRFLRFRIVRHQ
ncbi:MAG: GntR family transcriptional regulator [Candidatus Dormibacteraeota bacterium]|nr:GntR family transcriptional regulator [Candidatus Dormibacteraeota bacterium]